MEQEDLNFKNSNSGPDGFIRIFLDHGTFGYQKIKIFFVVAGVMSLIFTMLLLSRYWQGGSFNGSIIIYGPLSLLLFFQAYVTLHPKNASRIEIYEDRLLINQKAFGKATIFKWNEINVLHLWSYQVAFTLHNGNHYSLKINTENPEISKKIKAFLRRLAIQKGISIDG